jgi:RNA polymerase sigma-70 factor (ECF subfamily)
MDSLIRATGSLGALSSLSPAKKRRRNEREAFNGGITADGHALGTQVAVEEASTPGRYARGTALDGLSDPMLVELVLAGDQDAFSGLVDRYKDAVQSLAYRMLNNTTEAEDVTQETFVRAYTQLSTYKPAHKFSTWLLSIASHLSIDQLRRRRFLALPLEDVPFLEWIVDRGTGPEQSALAGEQQDEVQDYLQRLPAKYRAVLVLRYWHDFSYEEIATALNLTPALVKARLHRARELLGRYMKPGRNFTDEEEQINALP